MVLKAQISLSLGVQAPRLYKIFLLNSTEHEILTAHKNKHAEK